MILDACCGGRHFWFDKKHPNAVYIDIRQASYGHEKHRPHHRVNPDIKMDFHMLGFHDETFELVVFDPPHLKSLSETSIFAKKYGCLNKMTWQRDIGDGFRECWRVLKPRGILIFKWSETEIPIQEVLKHIPEKPLFGHTVGSKIKTIWLTFMKIP